MARLKIEGAHQNPGFQDSPLLSLGGFGWRAPSGRLIAVNEFVPPFLNQRGTRERRTTETLRRPRFASLRPYYYGGLPLLLDWSEAVHHDDLQNLVLLTFL